MASKRTSQGNDERDLQVPSKQRRHGNPEKQAAETQKHLSFLTATSRRATNDIALYLEPVIRKVVQEVIPPMLQRHLTSSCGLTLNQLASGTSGGRRLQLCFVNKLPKTIFTQSDIRAEGGEPLQFELRDATHQQRIVMDEGSSMKIRIRVLYGEFGSKGEEDWTAEEFNAQIARPREGKGPLLSKDTVIRLKDGVGYINEKIVFTDISGCKRFRLGLQMVQSNYCTGADIREGRSEPFRVKDHRGKPYEKHDPPLLNDEVWRLRWIRKDGKLHEQLTNHGIKTVKDLLQLNITNQASLREKIGKTAGKSWSKIIAHAEDCRVDDDDDDKRYFYYATEQSIYLVFNCIYKVVEVTFDGQNYRSIPSLNPEEKHLVERVTKQAYNNLKDLMPLDTTTTHGLVGTSTGVQTAQYGAPDQVLQQLDNDIPFAHQGQPEAWPSNSSILGEMLPYCSAGEPLISGAYTDDRVPQIDPFASCLLSPNYQWEQVNFNPFSFGYGDGAECSNPPFLPNSTVYIPRRGKRKTVWHKIRTAFKFILHSYCTRS